MKWLPFNQGSTKTQIGVAILLGLFILALATKCSAGDGKAYSQVFVGTTTIRGQAPVIDLSFVYPKAAPGDAELEVGATFIGESDYRGSHQQNNFALRTTIVEKLWRFDVGLGAAYLQNTDTYNGSNLNFNLLLGYRFKHWPMSLRPEFHFSNGGTRSPNKGRDLFMLGVRFEK